MVTIDITNMSNREIESIIQDGMVELQERQIREDLEEQMQQQEIIESRKRTGA